MNHNWLTLNEALQYLKIKSPTTLRTIARKYRIRQSKIMRMVYFNREDIDRMLNDNGVTWSI